MQKIHLLFILFIFPISLFAQQRTKIILQSNEAGRMDAKTNATHLKKPVFLHNGATLTCDSAILYSERNVFEAFSNVHINQGDTINIFSDHLIYDGNTKIALLTRNVRMLDNLNVLTTDNFTYNTGTQNGTYVDGGKIVSKDVTVTSKNGHYLGTYKDTYFRYDVVTVTPEVRITSDTMRYNTLTKITYFYGPTNIKGKGDNLYTENGAYNTQNEQAFFGKKNLYTNGSKSLKGDSLYYNGVQGVGRAVKNIVFKDTSDKTIMYGQLGYYYKADERALVTKNAYVGLGTADSVKVGKKMQPDSIWLGADTLETQMALQKKLILIESPVLKKDNELGEEEKTEEKGGAPKTARQPTAKPTNKALPPTKTEPIKKLSKKEQKALDKAIKEGKIKLSDVKTDSLIGDSTKLKVPDSILTDSLKIKKAADSLKKTADSLLKKPVVVEKKTDSVAKKPGVTTDKAKVVPKGSTVAKGTTLKGAAAKAGIAKTTLSKDTAAFNPLDTVRTRIIKAYHNVRVYKSNMQAVADSLFYTNADSTLRWYGKPILWSQNSQQTGDTIYLRLKNKKLNTLQAVQNSFMVNVNTDSAKFNQVKGKLITAFFTNGEISNVFVDGNAESVYYATDKDSAYTDMNQTVSSRIKILFKDKKITKLLAIRDPEALRIPIKELKEDVLLTGFIWKPELKPLSKKEIITGKPKPKAPAKKPVVASKATTTAKKGAVIKKPDVKTNLLKGVVKQADSLLNKVNPAIKKDVIKAADSIQHIKPDSLIKKLESNPLKKL
ncbi:OstA-like protein [Pedobacter frigoris]|uniref:OstA-like protein n=1 Tax=Pedobacter frigoris TaxID=2571272 RepID=UPI00292D66C8|nr:OstA-like protein [Pedobacter frigoris]